MELLSTLGKVWNVFTLVLGVLLAYQVIYIFIGLILLKKKNRSLKEAPPHRMAAVIAARNEASVIATVISDLKNQNYPEGYLDIYVVADNCTDDTAAIARKQGAIVYERFDTELLGKGYALDYLFKKLLAEDKDKYDAFMVFDADNLVDKDYTMHMNAMFSTGKYGALTSYRNSSNFDANWISAGYAIWFLREARFINFPRQLLHSSCHISGTGFLVDANIIRENGGWPFFLMTEDIQFSSECAKKRIRIGFCEKAMVYDEQPTRFSQAWTQRLRWSKGFLQVARHYAGSLFAGIFTGKNFAWGCYDMLMTVLPGSIMIVTLFAMIFGGIALAIVLTPAQFGTFILSLWKPLLMYFLTFYAGMFMFGIITTIVEWKQIHTSGIKKILYNFTFPFFMLTYLPISIEAFFRKVKWTPIKHVGVKERKV